VNEKQYVRIAIDPKAHRNLRLLAAMSGMTLMDTVKELAAAELERQQHRAQQRQVIADAVERRGQE
jgi:hypothetical protein